MTRISPADLVVQPFRILDQEWALLVAGRAHPNPMTVSWGGFGTLWNRPTVTVYVRPTRHTFACLGESQAFTLNFMPPELRRPLEVCGELSGRAGDKWRPAGIEPEPSETIDVPRVRGAVLSLECKVMATADFEPSRMLDPTIDRQYPQRDYHRVFWGAVLAAWQR